MLTSWRGCFRVADGSARSRRHRAELDLRGAPVAIIRLRRTPHVDPSNAATVNAITRLRVLKTISGVRGGSAIAHQASRCSSELHSSYRLTRPASRGSDEMARS